MALNKTPKKQGASLFKNTIIYTIGNLGSKLFSFILIPFFTFYLSKAELGFYDLLLTTISLMVPLCTFQISDAIYRWLADTKDNILDQKKIISDGFSIIVSLLIIILFLVTVFSFFIDIMYFNLLCILLICSSFFPFIQQVSRGLGRVKLYSETGVLLSFLIVSLTVPSVFVFNNPIEGILWSTIIANIAAISYAIYNNGLLRRLELSFRYTVSKRKMLKYSIPLLFNIISWWLINASDRYIILYFLDIDQNGIYAISSKFPSIIVIINGIFMMAWQDLAIESKEKENTFFNVLFKKFIIFELTFAAVLISLSPLLIKYVISDLFQEAWLYMPFLFIGASFSAFSGFLGAGFLRAKKTEGVLYTSLLSAGVNLVITIGLIDYIGLFAPAIGTFIGFAVMFIFRYREIASSMSLKINIKQISLLTLYVLILSLIVLFPEELQNIYYILFIIITTIIIFLWMNQSLLKHFYAIINLKIKKK